MNPMSILKNIMKPIILITLLLWVMEPLTFGQDNYKVDKSYTYVGFNIGTWFPIGPNQVLGNPLLIGGSYDKKFEKNSLALTLDFLHPGHHTKVPINILDEDTLLTVNRYFSSHITLDYSRQIWETNRASFEVMLGIGYGALSYDIPDSDKFIGQASFIVNPGFNIRYVLGETLFLQLKIQYFIANYTPKDNISTDLRGNYLVTKLIIGGLY